MADGDNNQQRNDPPRRKGRGPTKLNEVVVRQGTNVQPIRVDFDDDMNPIGEVGANFISYIGFVVRNRISILVNDWRRVNKDVKDQCWSDILVCFIIILLFVPNMYVFLFPLNSTNVFVIIFSKILMSQTHNFSRIFGWEKGARCGRISRIS